MTVSSDAAKAFFIISAEDADLACSVLQARFASDDASTLLRLIPDVHADDPYRASRIYFLDTPTWRRIVEVFEVPFDTASLGGRDIAIALWMTSNDRPTIPYLVHGGCELVLLIDGRKKLARFTHFYPPMTFDGENAYDRHVATGFLQKVESLDPFDEPGRGGQLGERTVHYAISGEEWRAQAMKLLWVAAEACGGWNETLERLQGMLLGYEDWQNDWWIEDGKRRGFGFFGLSLLCTVNAAGLSWLKSAGCKALPPPQADYLTLSIHQPDRLGQPEDLLADDTTATAVVRFNIPSRILRNMVEWGEGGPWRIPASDVPKLNRSIIGSIDVIHTRAERRS